ncbi:hypothetical protein BU26DRAFT_551631 [Trematosphaeria pertusa]|uniref:Uncharacterized protein n=1 Tax=Trematosphaeria pertusa TaxID=390896 RepID=A0A6A6ICZ4_9PLEO|nr:uncharacterized protein BU26DRAFT_551631 [Trematosphaeria pertusa]KAF2248296.1 hypothetical protein BU26DRAFT_551631 [Trematosphaeria pertusa]
MRALTRRLLHPHRAKHQSRSSIHGQPSSIPAGMPHFLTIPRELRDEIITLILLSCRETPRTPSEIEDQDREVLRDISLAGWNYPAVFYSKDAADYTPTCLPLLLTNKQLHAETKENLERLPAKGTNYELDVKFVKEQYLAPTWALVPVLSERVNHVRAVFQSTGTFERNISKAHLRDIWRRGCGGPPGYVWMFYILLERFLHAGPVGRCTHDEQKPVTINCLELDFIDPEDTSLLPPEPVTPEQIYTAMQLHIWSRRPNEEEFKMLRPEWLESELRGEIQRLLRMGYHYASYGGILHERIGSIVFKVNGEITKELDVGQILAEQTFNEDFGSEVMRHQRVGHWIAWRERAIRVRKERGLKVVEPEPSWRDKARAIAERLYGANPQH